MAGLTNKQQAFINEYLKTWNAAEAARRAGYSEKTAREIGRQNLAKLDIKAEIDRRIAENAMSADEVVARLTEQGRVDYSPYMRTDPESGRLYVDGKKLLADGKGHLIKSIKETRYGQDVEFFDAQAALIQLGRYHKLFTDKQEQSGPDGKAMRVMIEYADDNRNAS